MGLGIHPPRLSDRLKRCESQLRRSETHAEAKAEERPGEVRWELQWETMGIQYDSLGKYGILHDFNWENYRKRWDFTGKHLETWGDDMV